MQNPFEALSNLKSNVVNYDEWGGAFSCQERGCYLVAPVAKYIGKEKLLTWICDDGHMSKLEDVDE